MYPYHHLGFIQSYNSFKISHNLFTSGFRIHVLRWSWDGQNHSKALQCQYITPQSTINPCFRKTLEYKIYNKIKIKQHSFLGVLSPLFKTVNFEANSPFQLVNFEANSPFQLVNFHAYSCKLVHNIMHRSFTYHFQILIATSQNSYIRYATQSLR